tara:strand:+ start:233 stop:454 length:222 start_codon:yes stop_codon:yes gene_type:complete
MKGRDIADAVLGVSPIPLVGERAALRYIGNSQYGLDAVDKVSDRNIRFASARIAAYAGTALFTYIGSLIADKM